MKTKSVAGTHSSPISPSIPRASFPIVGIGASAGGLAAFESFFSGLPVDAAPGMAFVLVQHLAPDHKSMLAELIQRYTHLQVFEVKDGIILEPNCAYIIPPGFDMAFLNGALQLFEPSEPRGLRLPIDFFFRSLAQDQCDRAIGIILSGTGSDGTLGVRAIKGGGGMVMVQTPETTEFDGMPRSVIATGLADYELPPDQMAAALIAFSSHAFKKKKSSEIRDGSIYENSLKKIFILVRSQTGHDFSSYKGNTIRRRIERRMAVHQIDTIEKYLLYLQQSTLEIDALFKDLLIGVTSFFRDTESFKALKDIVIPKLFVGKTPASLVRVWSTGCSTGEEAYSIAILLQEYMESLDQNFIVQVFATDIDPHAITSARSGIFPASITMDILPEYLERFFSPESIGPDSEVRTYRIQKNIRDMIIFSEHNVIKDPPFSKLDLISCRNLMIYLSGDVQKKLIPLFHYALNPNGFLFLGTSESVGEFNDLFQLIDRKAKLYLRKNNSFSIRRPGKGNSFLLNTTRETTVSEPVIRKQPKSKVSPRELTEQVLLKHFAPPSALVNGKGDIFFLYGRTGMYLEPAVGEVGGYNIIKMAREGLKNELSKALRKASTGKEVVLCPDLKVRTNGSFTRLNLTICPAACDDAAISDQMYLVVLEEAKSPIEHPRESGTPRITQNNRDTVEFDKPDATVPDNLDSLVESLREELRIKEEYLQATVEDLEISNEDLKSANEEMQSVNEEMQSTNEELETSKEELQSVNEELSTVNNELSTKVIDLYRVNNDMNNLLAGTGIATVFVNHQLEILRFTPTASILINLIPGDVGRPVNHILTNLSGYDSLGADIQTVLNSLIPRTLEVKTVVGDWFKMSILPYRTVDNVIEGAVINFVDITQAKKLQDELQIQLSDKLILLEEVHHRVKNNIASIEGLLSLQTDATINSEVKTALLDALSRVQSMRILYDNLLVSREYHEISIKTYIENLIDSLLEVVTGKCDISFEKNIADFPINTKNAISLGMIINELLTNVFKYAFQNREKGRVTISIDKNGKTVTLMIKDNGIGIKDDSTPGFGLTIVKMLVDQLNGSYSIENENGTKNLVVFELEKPDCT